MRATAPHQPVDWTQLLHDAVTQPGLISQAYQLFWRYSIGNQILALWQTMRRKIEPGPINTYRGWQKLGRQVRQGEKALTLVMPVQRKRKRHKDPPDGAIVQADASVHSCFPAKEITYTLFLERPYWFVLSQTDGPPIEAVAVPNWDESLALSELNIAKVPFRHPDGNCQGYAVAREVAVSPIAFMPHRTMFHEMAHVVLDHTVNAVDWADFGHELPRSSMEVEAEAVALICCSALGLPGEEFSRGYIQQWLTGNTIPADSVHRIFTAADRILRGGRPQQQPVESDATSA